MKVYFLEHDLGYDGSYPIGVFSTKGKADRRRRKDIVALIREMRRKESDSRTIRSYVKGLASELVVIEFTLDKPEESA